MRIILQQDEMDCGPSCLWMVAKSYKKKVTIEVLRKLTNVRRDGCSFDDLTRAASVLGFKTLLVKIEFDVLQDAPLPAIAFWNEYHFVVIYKVTKRYIYVADPALGRVIYSKREFLKSWAKREEDHKGSVLLFENVTAMTSQYGIEKQDGYNFSFLFRYLKPYYSELIQVFFGLLAATLIQLILPYLTKSVVDVGISGKNIPFIHLVLAAQVFLFVGKSIGDLLRSWVTLHISTKLNISMLSDFIAKLMRLTISYLEKKSFGDIIQRLGDFTRIENFILTSTLNSIVSFLNIIVFGFVLLTYDLQIFIIFSVGSILYVLIVLAFLKRRKIIDQYRFNNSSENQTFMMQLISGIRDVKLFGAQKSMRWEWEKIQFERYNVSLRSLKLEQIQLISSGFVNELKNVLITVVAAKSVIEGNITLGTLLSVQFIVGSLNGPLQGIIEFVKSWQDSKISLTRLGDIYNVEDEEQIDENRKAVSDIFGDIYQSLKFENVSFKYPGGQRNAISKVNFDIPFGKTTAIVGESGSGKTTIIKLILKFYEEYDGNISLGRYDLRNIETKAWRERCGTVLNDGFVFKESLGFNIALSKNYSEERLDESCRTANIQEYVDSLPMRYDTKMDPYGTGISQGQKQRLLIARAIYTNPDIYLLDEATNALDANNEKVIYQNLIGALKGKTVLVVAHRLSTIKSADQIVVMSKGEIAEIGNHDELMMRKGAYYQLVQNQLS